MCRPTVLSDVISAVMIDDTSYRYGLLYYCVPQLYMMIIAESDTVCVQFYRCSGTVGFDLV